MAVEDDTAHTPEERLYRIAEHGLGIGCEHTQRNFETAFYRSSLADNTSFEQWSDEGAVWHQDRAAKLWRQMLKDYELPPMDEAVDEALLAYMAKLREKIGVGS